MKNPFFNAYGAIVLALAAFAQYRGISFDKINESKVVPKTIRDNPGAYRSTYIGNSRYTGGK